MEDTKQKIIERIEKLQRITLANGANEFEVATATDRINAIRKKYGIKSIEEHALMKSGFNQGFGDDKKWVFVEDISIEELDRIFSTDEEDEMIKIPDQFDMYYSVFSHGRNTYWVNNKEFPTPQDAMTYIALFHARNRKDRMLGVRKEKL